MNTKVYEKTRYQNIYRHKKYKHYLVRINKPVRTSISLVNGKRILKLEEALKIRDNPKIKVQKSIEIADKGDFDTFYTNYTNYCENVQKYAKNTKYWTPDEIKKFFKTVEHYMDNNINKEAAYRTYIFTLIGFSTGARAGEIENLTFENFDSNNCTLTIKGTKTKSSDRVIDVSQKIIDEITKYKWHLINEFDYDIIKNELIFCNHKTKVQLSDATLRKYFYRYCDLAGVTKIRMYDLRHTFVATMMAEGKELYHISQRIGHSSYNTTVDKYGHLSNEARKEIAKTTDKYI